MACPCRDRTPRERPGKSAPRVDRTAHAGGAGERWRQCTNGRPRGNAARRSSSPAQAPPNRALSWRLARTRKCHRPGAHRSIHATTVCRVNFQQGAQASACAWAPRIEHVLGSAHNSRGCRSLAPSPASRTTRRFVTAPRDPAMAGSRHCEGSSFAADTPGCNGTACRMASCEWVAARNHGNSRRTSPRGLFETSCDSPRARRAREQPRARRI
jgi:hypothetical protein